MILSTWGELSDGNNGHLKCLRLDGPITVENVGELKGLLVNALEQEEEVAIDIEKVSKFDLSALQMLCSAHRVAISRNKQLSFRGCEQGAFEQACQEAGLSHQKRCFLAGGEHLCLWAWASNRAE